MIPYIAGAAVLAVAALGYKTYDSRLRAGDTAKVPFGELRPGPSIPMASWKAIEPMIPKDGLMNTEVTLTVTKRQGPLAFGSVMAPGGAGAIPVEFNVAAVVTIQRGSRYIKGGK